MNVGEFFLMLQGILYVLAFLTLLLMFLYLSRRRPE
jgi:hypothetical protein